MNRDQNITCTSSLYIEPIWEVWTKLVMQLLKSSADKKDNGSYRPTDGQTDWLLYTPNIVWRSITISIYWGLEFIPTIVINGIVISVSISSHALRPTCTSRRLLKNLRNRLSVVRSSSYSQTRMKSRIHKNHRKYHLEIVQSCTVSMYIWLPFLFCTDPISVCLSQAISNKNRSSYMFCYNRRRGKVMNLPRLTFDHKWPDRIL